MIIRGQLYAWRNSALLVAINHIRVMAARKQVGREASPSAGVIDSQPGNTTEAGGLCRYD
jgi:putative transposase